MAVLSKLHMSQDSSDVVIMTQSTAHNKFMRLHGVSSKLCTAAVSCALRFKSCLAFCRSGRSDACYLGRTCQLQ